MAKSTFRRMMNTNPKQLNLQIGIITGAVCFLIGSVFFWPKLGDSLWDQHTCETVGSSLFLFGSLIYTALPIIELEEQHEELGETAHIEEALDENAKWLTSHAQAQEHFVDYLTDWDHYNAVTRHLATTLLPCIHSSREKKLIVIVLSPLFCSCGRPRGSEATPRAGKSSPCLSAPLMPTPQPPSSRPRTNSTIKSKNRPHFSRRQGLGLEPAAAQQERPNLVVAPTLTASGRMQRLPERKLHLSRWITSGGPFGRR
jgi:hypothetical protein